MTNRILVGLATLLAIVMAIAPDLDAGAGGILSLALVVLGLLYGAMAVEDTSLFGVTAIGVWLAAEAGRAQPRTRDRRSPGTPLSATAAQFSWRV